MLRAAGLAVLASLVWTGAARSTAIPPLYVNYDGDNCTFQMTNDAGATVTTIAPGKYQVVISTHDPYGLTGACNGCVQFRLSGPGVTLSRRERRGDGTAEQHAAGVHEAADDGRLHRLA